MVLPELPELNTRVPLLCVKVPLLVQLPPTLKLPILGAMSVALEAVQLFGGNGYMAEYEVEQLCRDAKVLQIYAGTDEIQVGHIARALLA